MHVFGGWMEGMDRLQAHSPASAASPAHGSPSLLAVCRTACVCCRPSSSSAAAVLLAAHTPHLCTQHGVLRQGFGPGKLLAPEEVGGRLGNDQPQHDAAQGCSRHQQARAAQHRLHRGCSTMWGVMETRVGVGEKRYEGG